MTPHRVAYGPSVQWVGKTGWSKSHRFVFGPVVKDTACGTPVDPVRRPISKLGIVSHSTWPMREPCKRCFP